MSSLDVAGHTLRFYAPGSTAELSVSPMDPPGAYLIGHPDDPIQLQWFEPTFPTERDVVLDRSRRLDVAGHSLEFFGALGVAARVSYDSGREIFLVELDDTEIGDLVVDVEDPLASHRGDYLAPGETFPGTTPPNGGERA